MATLSGLRIYWFVIFTNLHAVASTSSQRDPDIRFRLVGESLELTLAVENGTTVVWDFTSHSDPRASFIIGSSRSSGQAANRRFQLDCDTPGQCRMVISDIRLRDAGLYRCLVTTEQSGSVTKPVADLTVLETEPTCNTIISYKTRNQIKDFKIRCEVSYSGTQQPFIHCRELSTDTAPSPATPVETGNSSYRSLSYTYDINVDRLTKETQFKCTTFLNMKNCPRCHVHHIWMWPDDVADKEHRAETQPVTNRSVPTTRTATGGETSTTSSDGAVPLRTAMIVVVFGVLGVIGVVIVSVLIVVAVVRKHRRRVEVPGQVPAVSGHQYDSSAVYQSSTDQQDAYYAEITGRPPADVVYENVPRQDPHYTNLDPQTVEHPSTTPAIYTKLNLRRGAEPSQAEK